VTLIELKLSQLLRKHTERNPALILILGFAVGALTNIYPWYSAIVFIVLFLFLMIPVIYDMVKENRRSLYSFREQGLLQPTQHAAAFVARTNDHYLVVGQAIEILLHPNLSTRSEISELGWCPEDIGIKDLQTIFNADTVLSKSGGYKEFDPPNGTKFSVSNCSLVTTDSPNLSLELTRTNYFTLKSVLPTLISNPDLRAELGNLDPALNLIPHSLCLHYIVRFLGTGDVLCMKRSLKTAYHGNLWSLTGEEQISQNDFKSGFPALSLFQRAICEEIFPLIENAPLEERWKKVSPFIESMKLWSLFVEEEIFNFTMFGVCQLKGGISDFIAAHNRSIDEGGSKDGEGKFFFVSQDGLLELLKIGKCTTRPLFSETEKEQLITAENLHPTSRYRIFRLLRAIHRKPL
jgi:hypothetical protein